jgi:hypothetical protein
VYSCCQLQSVSITTEVVNLNPANGDVYSIQHYFLKVSQWLITDQYFFPGTPVYSTSKTDRQDITEILLKVALNTTTFTRYGLLSGFAYPYYNPINHHGENSLSAIWKHPGQLFSWNRDQHPESYVKHWHLGIVTFSLHIAILFS